MMSFHLDKPTEKVALPSLPFMRGFANAGLCNLFSSIISVHILEYFLDIR
jgi:predicted membrane-bound spermidine synthase